ncbi:hypothetical protein ACFYT3_26875 [Nocardia amikacinitolerans]|uniref:hypothetical protein n=1 Tax=Nocardia amikacinitolerans TaxID=756689 RepID=UPI0020A4486A|nr:hypothetical protein [Nocardia amikacinitolerans]MCP2289804.1 hypothetical protein [Nocardia amikacinitolerans]
MSSQPSRPPGFGAWIARVIAIVLLVPVRLLWEAVRLLGRLVAAAVDYFVTRLLAPVVRFVWYWVIRPIWMFFKDFLWGWVLQHVLWGLVLTPVLALLLDCFLRPLRQAVERWLWRALVRPALVWLWRAVLEPLIGLLLATVYLLGKWLVVWPLVQLWRWALRPLWVLLRTVLVYGWRVATVIVGVLVVTPCRFVYRTVLRPLLLALAAVWVAVVVRPVRWAHSSVVTPVNRWAAEIMTGVFGR